MSWTAQQVAIVGGTITNVKITGLVGPSVIVFAGAGDGVTDNTAALNAALASLTGNGGSIFFPPGKYSFNSGIVYVMPAGVSVTLAGAGAGNTVLTWPNASGGITFTASNNQNTFHIRDLTLTTAQVGSGTALGFIGVGANSTQNFQSDIHNVQISGDDIGPATPTFHYWSIGIDVHNWGSVDIACRAYYRGRHANDILHNARQRHSVILQFPH
jgi:hypothetical protein